MDLVVDLNFRMDTSALYSDIVLPAATWYEKSDLNSTDMHSFVHPLSEAVPPCWESKSDWDIFRAISKKFSEMSERHFPETCATSWRVAAGPRHAGRDRPAEMKDWMKGEVEAIPGKTMPGLKVVTRTTRTCTSSTSRSAPWSGERPRGPRHAATSARSSTTRSGAPANETWNGETYPSIEERRHRRLQRRPAPGHRHQRRAGLPLLQEHGGEGRPAADPPGGGSRGVRMTYEDLQTRPHRYPQQPDVVGPDRVRTGLLALHLQPRALVPWRTLTGRQHFYLDHPATSSSASICRPTSRSRRRAVRRPARQRRRKGPTLMLNYLTPHGKWHIHSTYGDNQRMTTLSRGCEPFWINDKDAESIDIEDNDWVEVHNDHGVVVTRACVSVRIPRGYLHRLPLAGAHLTACPSLRCAETVGRAGTTA